MTNHQGSLEWRHHRRVRQVRKIIGYGDVMFVCTPWRRESTVVFWSHFGNRCAACNRVFAHYMTKCGFCGGELLEQTQRFR